MWEQLKRRSSCQILPSTEHTFKHSSLKISGGANRELNHPAFQSIRITQCDGLQSANTQTVITLTKLVTPQAMHQCLKFVYTGTIDKRFLDLHVSTNLLIITSIFVNILALKFVVKF